MKVFSSRRRDQDEYTLTLQTNGEGHSVLTELPNGQAIVGEILGRALGDILRAIDQQKEVPNAGRTS